MPSKSLLKFSAVLFQFHQLPHQPNKMTENDVQDADDLLDYDEEETTVGASGDAAEKKAGKGVKGTYVSIHSSGFRDFLLKPELLRAIVDCGFEHPSEGNIHQQMTYSPYSQDLIFRFPVWYCDS